MNLYEHTIVARQDVSPSQIKQLTEKYTKIVEKNDGKVGINETSPDQALHVKGTNSDTVPMRVQSTGATSRVGFEVAGSANSYNVSCGAAGVNIFGVYTNNTERFRIDSSGFVGFGVGSTYAPESPIDVFFYSHLTPNPWS